MKKSRLTLLSAAIAAQLGWASPVFADQAVQIQALNYLNDLRHQAGLIELQSDATLGLAAQGHAVYLQTHRRWGHSQRRSETLFTGETPLSRMLNAGYTSRHNSENVSSHSGSATPMKSINGLMSAIYHRFGFLSFDYDEIGIGYASANDFHSFVYNLGNSLKAALCEDDQQMPITSAYVFKVCSRQQKQIPRHVFDKALLTVQQENAAVVVWPPRQGHQVPPAFYDESPDPLPSYDVSGYPVSVQFNPADFSSEMPVVSRFELFEAQSGKPVKIIANFNQQTDINRKFNDNEHAIFPEKRLEWNTAYRSEVDYYTVDGQKHELSWQFTTAALDGPMQQVQGGEVLTVSDESLYVYSPPVSARDAKAEYLVSYRGFSDVKVTIVDAHTLKIMPLGLKGQAMFEFHGKRFTVIR